MNFARWNWEPCVLPGLVEFLATPPEDPTVWRGYLERLPGTDGKVLAVCVALEVVRELRASLEEVPTGVDDERALSVLSRWIDDPVGERFDTLAALLFKDHEDGTERGSTLSGVVWWALRCATVHPDGAGELEWALDSFCMHVGECGLSEAWIFRVALGALRSRSAVALDPLAEHR